MGILLAWLVGGGAVLVVMWGVFNWFAQPSALRRYNALERRLSGQLAAVTNEFHVGSTPASGLHGFDRTRAEIAMALNTALANRQFLDPGDQAQARLQEIVDRIDRTGGRELRTAEGCLRLWAEFEQKFPDSRDYAWLTRLHEYQEAGDIGRLPAAAPRGP